MPILWHIMKIYSMYDLNDFVICCRYKMEVIKDYFLNSLKSKNIQYSQNHITMTVIQESSIP